MGTKPDLTLIVSATDPVTNLTEVIGGKKEILPMPWRRRRRRRRRDGLEAIPPPPPPTPRTAIPVDEYVELQSLRYPVMFEIKDQLLAQTSNANVTPRISEPRATCGTDDVETSQTVDTQTDGGRSSD